LIILMAPSFSFFPSLFWRTRFWHSSWLHFYAPWHQCCLTAVRTMHCSYVACFVVASQTVVVIQTLGKHRKRHSLESLARALLRLP
jgi:hypothetical protein